MYLRLLLIIEIFELLKNKIFRNTFYKKILYYSVFIFIKYF